MSVVSVAHGATVIELVISAELYGIVQELANMFDVDSKQEFTAIELHALFLRHCKEHNENAALAALGAFCKEFDVPATNIHVVVQQQDLSEEAARLVLNAYYLLWDIDAARCYYFSDGSQTLPALFSADSTHLMAAFGGQAGSPSYLDEARWLLDVYSPLLSDFVMHMSEFLDAQARDAQLSDVYEKGLCVFRWLTQPGSEPDAGYLTAVPVSIPLTGLIQLMQLMVLYKTLGVSPGDLAQLFHVATGHSQGIVIATALSMFSDEQSFYEISTKALGVLMLVGAIPCIEYPHFISIDSSDISADPRPMVSVRGVSQATLEALLVDFNVLQLDENHVYLSIINTHNQFVVSGSVESSIDLVEFLRSRSASPDTDQSKVPFNLRQPVIPTEYVDIIAPYHCTHLDDVVDMACGIAREKQWVLDSNVMKLPVRTCDDGHDIREEADILWYMFQSTCVLPVNWPQALAAPDVSHIVDFGPSSFSAHGQLIFRNVEGRGISVISASALTAQPVRSNIGVKSDLYKSELSEITAAPDWQAECGPRLVRIGNNGPVHIDTRMHRVLGMPTVMVAGMTPTTASEQFVAAIMNAGYHAEIAGGGIHTESDMVTRLHHLAESIAPGHGITLNCIYVNQRQWSFQFTTLLRLRREGLPIAGLCIGGGVPSFDKALEIISKLRSAGIRHMSFKPSSAEAVRHVIKIAQASDGFPIVLQWTGGRGGGHHSFEDFHQPILETYAAIRKCDNIVLIAGSGFGDAEGTLPYMTGDWSVAFGQAPMPFDGILLGSRVMVAQEAGTSLAVKELIVAAAGTSDSEWHKTHNGGHGGVASLLTEYGESNHALDTRSVPFIRDMQLNILSQPRNTQLQLLLARKDEIISRLNSDYMRPWFGRTADGRVVDLEEMTYAEVICRLVELMYVTHQQRWVHESHLKLVVDFISRCECRMSATAAEIPISILLNKVEPTAYADTVVGLYPGSKTQLLTSEDVQFFVQLCKRRGQKPLPFIPVLDLDFGVLLLKDAVWQSEDLASVVDQDPQRVGIQQGPVAAQYSTRTDEPVKDIIDGIYNSHVAALLERLHNGDESSVPVVEYIGAEPATNLPNQMSAVKTETEHPISLQVVGSSGIMELELGRIDENGIVLTVHHETVSGNVVLLKLEYSYCPGCILAPIHGSKVQNDEVIRQFYIEAALNNPSAPETKPDKPGSDLSLAI
ncbi:fatty acid synthase alpha subunit Lsd1, partial [Coemansia sp. RSA 1199]